MDRTIRLGTAVLLASALALTVVVGRDVADLVGRPVPGPPLFANGVVSLPLLSPASAAPAVYQFRPADRVVAVDGLPVESASQIRSAAERAGVGARLRYTVDRPGVGRLEIAAPVSRFERGDLLRLYVPFLVIGLLFLGAGALPILVRPDLASARAVFALSLGLSTSFALLSFDYFTAQRFTPWLRALSFLSMGALLHLAWSFPEPIWPLTRHPRATVLGCYGSATALFVLYAATFWDAPRVVVVLDVAELLGFVAAFVLLTANLLRTALTSASPLRRKQARLVLPGPCLVALGVSMVLASSWGWLPVRPSPVVVLAPALGTVLLLTYAMLEHNVFDFDAVVRRTLTFGVLALAAIAAYVGVLAAVEVWLGALTAWASLTASAVFLLVLVPTVGPLRRRVEPIVEATLFPERRRAREVVRDASRALVRLHDTAEIARFLRSTVELAIGTRSLRIVVGRRDEAMRELAAVDAAEEPFEIPRCESLHGLLASGGTFNVDRRARTRRSAAATRLARETQTALAVGFPVLDGSAGGLLLGPRRDGQPFSSEDEVLLETLAGQAAIAIEHARAWEEIRELQRRLAAENLYLRDELAAEQSGGELVGRSPALRSVVAQIHRAGPTDATVLVLGETGTGKELVVRALHRLSRRSERVLVKVACAAVPESLLESELFGHEKGAFTGATARKLGRFEIADGGTLFFDDVDTLPLGVQAKLLRVLQEGEIQRLGDNVVRHVDVRVLAASNRDLLAEVRGGRFREDLYYRLNVVPIHLPPLRERREDIALLVEHFVAAEGARHGRHVTQIPAEAMAELERHDWPGNVRELRNVVERAIVMSSGPVLRLPGPLGPREPADPAAAAREPASGSAAEALGDLPFAELVKRYKVGLITAALQAADGNHAEAARILGLHRPSLVRMVRELGLRGAFGTPANGSRSTGAGRAASNAGVHRSRV